MIYIVFIFWGYFTARQDANTAKLILEEMKKTYGPLLEMNVFRQFLFVFFNNGLTLFLVLIFGIIFGVFPFLVLFANGAILGILVFLSESTISWPKFFLGTMPHGIIEIPVMILACAAGLKIGRASFLGVFKKQGNFKNEFFSALNFFLKILLPLLFLAAAIEIFITAKILGI